MTISAPQSVDVIVGSDGRATQLFSDFLEEITDAINCLMAEKKSLINGVFLETTPTLIYTPPEDFSVEITHLAVTNNNNLDADVNLWILEDEEASPVDENNVLLDFNAIKGRTTTVIQIHGQVIPRGATLHGETDNANEVTIFLNGIEIKEA